jgi:hypothetical protein
VETADRVADVMRRPEVYGIRTLEQATAFFTGFDAATEFTVLEGFREWLSRNGGDGPNLTWAVQVSRLVGRWLGPEAGDEERLREFFRLVREFLVARGTPVVTFDDVQVLAVPGALSPAWIAGKGKAVAPVAVPAGVDRALLERLRTGARVVGASEVLKHSRDGDPVRLPVDERLTPELVGAEPALLVLPDQSGAVLTTGLGYALVGGTLRFLRGALPGGVDQARARFAREARKLAVARPGLLAVAERFPCRAHAWKSRDEVASGSAVAGQLALMESFVRRELPGGEFARSWRAAGRLADERGERVRGALGQALSEVFFLLEDYPIDPALREPGDVTEEELLAGVRNALESLSPDDTQRFPRGV